MSEQKFEQFDDMLEPFEQAADYLAATVDRIAQFDDEKERSRYMPRHGVVFDLERFFGEDFDCAGQYAAFSKHLGDSDGLFENVISSYIYMREAKFSYDTCPKSSVKKEFNAKKKAFQEAFASFSQQFYDEKFYEFYGKRDIYLTFTTSKVAKAWFSKMKLEKASESEGIHQEFTDLVRMILRDVKS